jgi:uncharacterized protein YecE (DUF72 family)
MAGASGYSFKEWKGTFYPSDLRPDGMLAWYSARLPTVEINNTFYRTPPASVLEGWAGATPADFRFAIKASRRITHISRLKAESVRRAACVSLSQPHALGEKRGPVLFQLPPNLKKDLPRLTEFLALLPQGTHGGVRVSQLTPGSATTSTTRSRGPGRRCASRSARTTRRRRSSRPHRGAMSGCGSKRIRPTT